MSLSIRDVLVLDFFNGKPVHAEVPAFQQDIYGNDANTRIHDLCDEGWIRHSRPQETVNLLPDKALAHFLLAHGLPSTGSHAELVGRVINEIPEEEYAHAVPKVYVATADGNQEIAHHMAYILNVRGNYGFSEGEIGDAQRTLSAKDASTTAPNILTYAFQQKSALFVMAGEWTKLRNLYFTWANFCLRFQKNEDALTYLCLVFFLDMSGMENRNSLVQYEKLFPTQKGIILLMNQIRGELSLTDTAMKSFFLTAIARTAPRIPFSYFSPQTMGTLLLERLSGIEFSHQKYDALRNQPDATAGAYHCNEPGERDTEKTNSRPADAFLIKRKALPTVPPVLRVPTFTAPPPFIPPGTKREETSPEKAKPPLPKENKPSGWLGKIQHFLKGTEEDDKK